MSRIGKLPVNLPKGVTVNVSDTNMVSVKGPLGELTQARRRTAPDTTGPSWRCRAGDPTYSRYTNVGAATNPLRWLAESGLWLQ